MKSFKKNKEEIFYNLINSGLAGSLVLLGSFTTGHITFAGVGVAIITAFLVAVTKFKEYWTTQKSEYTKSLLNFV